MVLKQYTFFLLLAIVVWFTSCKKFLETKSDQSLSTPETLEDLQAILNDPNLKVGTILNFTGSDEYYFEYADWLATVELHKKGYIWDPELDNWQDWRQQYNIVFNANTVLYNLENISSTDQQHQWNHIKGCALFYRALSFYQIAQLYAPQYDPASASTGFGIPLRLDADFNKPSTRSTVQQTYDRIIQDLEDAHELLGNNLPINKTQRLQPTRPAVLALLARVFLQIGNYSKAKEKADICLQAYNRLLDFNSTVIDPSSSIPITPFNDEVLFHVITSASANSESSAKIDTSLFKTFEENDLRKKIFFELNADNVSYRFKGSYAGGSVELFNGLATDEIYLIRAECNARLGNTVPALQDLNLLLEKRWKSGTFVPVTADSPNDALKKILLERRKELLYRGIRWSDLKRLNKNPEQALIIKRNLNGQSYTLSPGDLRYTLLIPLQVMNEANLQQNPR